jgi:Core-2/I-Branching enzyme
VLLPLLLRRPPPVPLFHGSTWWALTHRAASWVLGLSESGHPIMRSFRHSFFPDEAYFPTVLMSSPLAQRIAAANLTFSAWTPTSGPHPKVLTTEDFGTLLASSKLFARKFDAAVDARILDLLDEAHTQSDAHEAQQRLGA